MIEGAHSGSGLGDRFLGHIERCRVLLHLVDGTVDDAGKAYDTCAPSSTLMATDLREKPEIVALNKADALTPDEGQGQITRLRRAVARHRKGGTVYVMSAVTGEGVPTVLRAILAEIDAAMPPARRSSRLRNGRRNKSS